MQLPHHNHSVEASAQPETVLASVVGKVDALTKPTGGTSKESKSWKLFAAFLGIATLALLISTIVFATTGPEKVLAENIVETEADPHDSLGANPCNGKKPHLENLPCAQNLDDNFSTGEQSGANVTKGYVGSRNTTAIPIAQTFRDVGLCPVNVHWHLGTEHYSVGEYDETGTGPLDFHEARLGFQCKHYDETDPKFTTPYNWQHCVGMTVGQTYEVHWPHSAAGMCHTPWQYQTPFYDGVFCRDNVITDTAQQIGVQSQTFVIVNDEDYYYPDLFTGMIVDQEKGTDIAIYTGSATGTEANNIICSPFSPITWHVDRKCHVVSASSFDKMCGEMKQQPDNMSDDLEAHGARELVHDIHVANNQQTRRRTLQRDGKRLRNGN